ncbi:hypothetical protein LAZ67_4001546 [Cordylochernes scorpioides]|uniref:Transposase n=1 Tax=Cordylochernes scorpioides TaxID=51811 RepID=A0ABY6KDA8_9ARAC|nr:hypothetical protein LAZ67_4001546 [Cordylochernes scorpioides]
MSLVRRSTDLVWRFVNMDETWVHHYMPETKQQSKQWVEAAGDTPKPRIKKDLHPQKAMICVFWDCEGVLYWEMLGRNATVNKDLYIAQLHRVNEAIQQKRPDRQCEIILLYSNARPHVAQVVKAALQELEWEVLQHPAYSPDLAPTDYHLFRSMSNHMRGTTFDDEEDLKTWLNNFDTRPGDFWRNGINKLVERWEEVVKDFTKTSKLWKIGTKEDETPT